MQKNTYTTGEQVPVPGTFVGRPVQCYDNQGAIFAGQVVAARYVGENLLADVAVLNDQDPGTSRPAAALLFIQRDLTLGSSSDPRPFTFAVV